MEVRQLTGRWRNGHRGCLWVTSVTKQKQNRLQAAVHARWLFRTRVRMLWLIGVDVTAWLALRWSRWVKAQGSSQVERWRRRRKSIPRASVILQALIHSVEYQSWLTGKDLYGLPLSSQVQTLSFGETHDSAQFHLCIYLYDITYCWMQNAHVIEVRLKHFEVWIKCCIKIRLIFYSVQIYSTSQSNLISIGLTVN